MGIHLPEDPDATGLRVRDGFVGTRATTGREFSTGTEWAAGGAGVPSAELNSLAPVGKGRVSAERGSMWKSREVPAMANLYKNKKMA
jgi:hypothetical protein